MKIGVPEDFFEYTTEDVKKSVTAAIEKFREMGAEIEYFRLPFVNYGIPTYYVLACAQASSNLSRYDGIKYGYSSENAEDLLSTYIKSRSEGFGMEVKRRIMLGNFVLSSGYYDAYYKKALKVQNLIRKTFSDIFEKYDLIVGPVTPTTALKFGETFTNDMGMSVNDIYTVLSNIAGVPSISVPCGFDSIGLPVGLQIMGRAFDDKKVLQLANAYQTVTAFHKHTPKTDGGAQ
ncbi:MAG: Asp-tRNA(Asn)/Glu-tRNA(Gln) amidotransferase subunit GatA, partial [Clostridia bacterium]|nr:Asp-tRNA(Asn)/Glu-tRNA(Gln) amidotransferase subunit GatA [Clostridia bacterium]